MQNKSTFVGVRYATMIKHKVYFTRYGTYVLTKRNRYPSNGNFHLVKEEAIEFVNIEYHRTYMFCLHSGMFYSTEDISRMKQDLIKRNSGFNKIWKFLRIFKLRLSLLSSKINV